MNTCEQAYGRTCERCQAGQHERCEGIVGFTYDSIMGECADYCSCEDCLAQDLEIET
jgi:hypothetical protein